MTTGVVRPRSAAELSEIVLDAASTGRPLEACGGGTMAEVGRPRDDRTRVDMTGFDGLVAYDPAELVLTVGAGTRLAEIEALLAEKGQMLAFDPVDHAQLFGKAPGAATIGGIIGARAAGPRRLSAGSVRDHLLGFRAVSGRGEEFIAGGKVVKNVTGYDLSKLMAGSWGQLALLTEVTLKVLPRPRHAITLLLSGLTDREAVAAMALALGSQADVAAAAHLPAAVNGGTSATLVRLEGFESSVAARFALLRGLLGAHPVAVLDGEEHQRHWSSVRQVTPLAGEQPLWRINLPPSAAPDIADWLERGDGRWLFDWSGGLIWATLPVETDAAALRAAVAAAGGHAMLVRAPPELRTRIPIHHPEPPALAALSRRVRQAFDPAGILDPQRFTANGDADQL